MDPKTRHILAVSVNWGVLFGGCPYNNIRALLFGFSMRAPDLWKTSPEYLESQRFIVMAYLPSIVATLGFGATWLSGSVIRACVVDTHVRRCNEVTAGRKGSTSRFVRLCHKGL